MTEDLLSKFKPEERERLHRIRREVKDGQRSESPLDLPLRTQAENIRVDIETRAKHNDQAMRLVIADRKKGLPVTRLGMRMETKSKLGKEIINLGIVVGTGSGEEDGTVSIRCAMMDLDESGQPVDPHRIEVKILVGGKFFIRSYDQGYSAEVLDEREARTSLHLFKFFVDKCLTQPNPSFYRLGSNPSAPSLTDKIGS